MKTTRVAWRGLWDRFGPPESLEAIHRALRKGFATRIRSNGPADLMQAAELFLNSATNPKRMPIVLAYDDPSQLHPFLKPGHPAFFAQYSGEPDSLQRFEDGQKVAANGLYLRLGASLPDGHWPWIALEMPDIHPSLESPLPDRFLDPDSIQNRYPNSELLHLMDFVEWDCLKWQPRWESHDEISTLTVSTVPESIFRRLLSWADGSGLAIGLSPPPFSLPARICAPDFKLDAFLHLAKDFGFERHSLLLTWGLRHSAFAPILFWEAFHTLACGGRWLDLDQGELCHGTELCDLDYQERKYFSSCLQLVKDERVDAFRLRCWEKTRPSLLSDQLNGGWTFGILTGGPSPQATRMAHQILSLGRSDVEIIICGPQPEGLPGDSRIRIIDLDHPEPRGWISKKKNLIARAASYPNLCLLHDRFEIPGNFFEAMDAWGPLFGVLGLPQKYVVDQNGHFSIRYPDYEVLMSSRTVITGDHTIFNDDNIFHPDYSDYRESAFVCGGAYIAKRLLFDDIGQDESLFHCEWEDIAFGQACIRQGIPQRINPFATLITKIPHPLCLTRLNTCRGGNAWARYALIPDEKWVAERRRHPASFLPIIKESRMSYFRRISQKWNYLDLDACSKIAVKEWKELDRLSTFWELVHKRVQSYDFKYRKEVAAVIHFLASSIYTMPNCQQQRWIQENEAVFSAGSNENDSKKRIGWGASSMLTTFAEAAQRDLEYLVDKDRNKWGKTIHGLKVYPPSRLNEEDPDALVVILSSYVSEIQAEIRVLGSFRSVTAPARYSSGKSFQPLAHLVSYFREVEQYYPVIFADSAPLDYQEEVL